MPSFDSVSTTCEQPEVARSASSSRAWSWLFPLAAVGLTIAAIVSILSFTAFSFVRTWMTDRSYQYGFVIVPIAFVLAWRRRHDLLNVSPSPCYRALILVGTAVVLWFLGDVADVLFVQQFALIAMLAGTVWSILGTKSSHVLLFSLAFLFFAVPAGKSLVPPLQDFTAWFTTLALRLSGIPVVLEDRILYLPTGNWEVAEACSGIRYLTTSIVVGVLFAGVTYRSWTRRLLFLLASIAVPLVANVIRAYGIVLLGYSTDNRLAAGVDHLIYGWFFFSIVTITLFLVGARWHEHPTATSNSPAPAPFTAGRNKFLIPALISLLLVIAGNSIASLLWARPPVPHGPEELISAPQEWVRAGTAVGDWKPELTTIKHSVSETFVAPGDDISVYFGSYSYGRRRLELVESYNAVAPASGWTVLSTEKRNVVLGGNRFAVTQNKLRRGSQMRLVWFWYSIGTQFTSDPYRVKWLQAWQRLLGTPQELTIVALSTPYDWDQLQAEKSLEQFVQQSFATAGKTF